MSNRTSSHICGRWYLPTFLFRDGSFVLMYMASFIALLRFWSSFNERFKEHQKAPSPIFDHYTTTGHDIKLENFSIVGKEDQNLKRAIKEAMYIRTNDPSLNRNVGKYHLPHIWDEVLFDIPELKLN